MNGDSFSQIEGARLGQYTNWYCPVLLWLWHPFYNLGFGPGYALVIQIALFVVGAFMLLRRTFTPIGAALVVAVISLSPQLFGELALVGRNTWFLSLLIACFACAAEALWSSGRGRFWWSLAAVVLAWFTLNTRQNAAFAVFVPLSLVAGVWLMHRWRSPRRRTGRARLIVGSLAIAIVSTLLMVETVSLAGQAVGALDLNAIGQLYLYDLASMSRDDGHDYIPKSVYPQGTVQSIDKLSSAPSILSLLVGPNPPIAYPFTDAANTALEHRWKHELLSRPLTYLRERLQLWGWTLGIGHEQLLIYQPGVPANPYGFSTRFTGANRVANDYEHWFVTVDDNGGALFEPWIYLLICLGAVVVGILRPTRLALVAGAIGLAALTYQIGLFFGQMGANYRYEFPCLAMGEIILALGLRELWRVGQGALANRQRVTVPVNDAAGART
jgi:hypothetical protein